MTKEIYCRKLWYLSLGLLAAAILSAGIFHDAEAETRQELLPLENSIQENDPPETNPPETNLPETDISETDSLVSETPGADLPGTNIPETEAPLMETSWYIVLSDITPVIPEGGRVYDGTDRISVDFQWRLIARTSGSPSAGKEDQTPPQVTVTCIARLASPHAGTQAVLYDFAYQTDDPAHVFMAADNPHPELTVDVLKRILTVEIPDGRKIFAAEADMDHIWPDESTADDMNKASRDREAGKVPQDRRLKAKVSGFLMDQNGDPVVPAGFRAPDVTVDNSVLKADSPMFQYGTDEGEEKEGDDRKKSRDADSAREAVYQNALVMKRDEGGSLSGNATADYAFCEEPSDERYHCGSVRIVSSKVTEGEDYVAEGQGLIREGGRLIIRSGTGLSVRTRSKSPYNTGIEKNDIQTDGSLTFRLKKVDRHGHVLAESLPAEISWKADGEVPAASVSVSGGHQENGLIFSDSSCTIRISVSQDMVSGMYQVLYRIRSGSSLASEQNLLPSSGSWISSGLTGPGEIKISEEGIFQAEVMTQDRVGNTAYALSRIFVIDQTKPACMIEGASDGSANSGEVRLVFTCSDRFYRKDSARYSVTSAFGGNVPAEVSRRQATDGISIRLADFEHNKSADAWYHVTFSAEDMAGNVTTEVIDFSVNRFGSSYGIPAETSKYLETYYHRKPFDVTYLESNLDQVNSPEVLVMRNGRKLSSVRLQSQEITQSSASDGLHHYLYRIPADTFRKDGRYEVILITSDKAGNLADTQARQFPVRFAIDHEKPECLVSGIKKKEIYRAKNLTVGFEVRDNLALDYAEVYLNAHLLKSYSASKIREAGGVFKVSLRESPAWQRLQFHVTDQAGNEYWTDEYLVFLSEEGDAPADQNPGESAEKLAEKEKRKEKGKEGRQEAATGNRMEAGGTEAETENKPFSEGKGRLQSAADLLAETEIQRRSREAGTYQASGPEERLQEKKKHDGSRAASALVFVFVLTYIVFFAIQWSRKSTKLPGGRKDG